MANKRHLAILKKGVKAWNKWRAENPSIQPDLSNAQLIDVKLNGINFKDAYLYEAILSGADLQNANLRRTDLRYANLIHANLCDTNISESDLREANLISADLRRSDLNQTLMCDANLCYANLSAADLSEADLTRVHMVGANLEGADISLCRIFGVSAWAVNVNGATQYNLIITQEGESTIRVDNLEVAQFIYLLLNNEKIRGVIDTIARKVVLILGRFGEHKPILDAIREELRKRDYLPVLFDFDKPATRDITETMRTLAHLSRFIIADISDPSSIPLELQAVVPDLAVPVQPLLLSGQREFSMFVDLRKKYHWVLATHQYTDIKDLLASLGDKVIVPAEQKAKELEKR